MKILANILLLALFMTACKNDQKKEATDINDIKHDDITTSIYPESITKVFDAHGGIDTWNKMKTLSFTMNKPFGKEVTTTNLTTRAERIETPNYTIGFDGKTLWVDEKNGEEYKGNARFYKGLMMYFYAMPFILGDNGIIYEEAEPLIFDGVTYLGILISYEAGVGESPDDQYLLYYDKKTGQMQWLGYTVTFGKDSKSKDFHFIRYNNWENINGLLLPKSIDWYTYENNQPIEKRNTVVFEDIRITKNKPNESLFIKPEEAKIID